ncbi:MAG: ABC transporter substrate-binding protein [Candidatus Hodarchaeales archaeon]|jgi:branched-chain amino acid transport system substrate-binding protein
MKKKGRAGILIIVIFMMIVSLTLSNPKASIKQGSAIKIGALGPFAITPGNDMKKGTELAVEEINDAGGVMVNGIAHNIELISETTSGTLGLPDVQTAMTSFNKLIYQDEVVAIIGAYRTEVAISLMFQLDRPFLGVGTTAPIISPFFWRVGFTNRSQLITSLVDLYAYGLSDQEVRNVTIVREDTAMTSAMSNSIKDYFNSYLPMYKGTTVINFTDDIAIGVSASYDNVISSLTPLLSEYQGLKVNALMTIITSPVGKYVTQAWAALNMSQILAGINIEAQSSTYFEETEGAAAGEIQLEFCPPDINQTSKTGDFKQAYYVKNNETPSFLASASYDAVYIIKDAIERADSTAAEALQAALTEIDYEGAAYKIRFTSELGSQKGLDSEGNPIQIPGAPENITVHDLHTIATIGVNSQPYMQGYYVQWQENGTRKTIWGHEPRPPIIISPSGGETFSGDTTISWTASVDTWGYSGTYTISHSTDGGTTWTTLIADLTATSYIWDTSTVPDGTSYILKVEAISTGGLNVTSISSNPFIIDNTPPTVTIDSPLAQTYTTDTITITLSGDATHYWYCIVLIDSQNQTWVASVDRTLTDGTHTLHAYGNDSAGNIAYLFVTFTIEKADSPTPTTTTTPTTTATTTSITPSWNVLLFFLSFIAMLPLRRCKKKT